MAVTAADVLNAAQQLSLPERPSSPGSPRCAPSAVEAGVLAEADLVRVIPEAVPPDVQRRYDQLKARRRAATLTEAEHQEFPRPIELVEHLHAQRLEHLLQLAHRRGVPLAQAMADLGLAAPAVE